MIFKSFDIKSEIHTVKQLIEEWVSKLMIIKRSWIFALMMIFTPLFILLIAILNIYIAQFYGRDALHQMVLIVGIGISVLLFLYSAIIYIHHFRQIYHTPTIRSDFATLLQELELGDTYFTRFFNQTILNQLILIGLTLWSIIYYLGHMRVAGSEIALVDAGLLFIQWLLLGRYRKRMIDLEMDYNIVVPGKIIFVNQSGMLSSTNTIEGEKVKTVSAKYSGWIGSFFHYGTVEIMTEGDSATHTGTLPMYYVTAPDDTSRHIQGMLDRETSHTPHGVPNRAPIHTPHPSPLENTETRTVRGSIGPREVTYDVKGTVRDVLR